MNFADELEQLHSLHLNGLLTADEYERAKSRVFDRESAEPEPFDWHAAAATTPASAVTPARSAEVTDKDLWRALEAGVVGGGVMGLVLSIAAGTATLPTAVVAALVGAFVWPALALGVKANAGRGLGAAALQFLHAITLIAYTTAAVILVGIVIYLKTQQPRPAPEVYIPPATVR